MGVDSVHVDQFHVRLVVRGLLPKICCRLVTENFGGGFGKILGRFLWGMFDVNRKWVSSLHDLIGAIRERRDELDLSCLTIDHIAGYADGYSGKLLAPRPMKGLGPKALEALLGALALKIARIEIVEDLDQAAKVSGRWKPRKRCSTRPCAVALLNAPQAELERQP